MPTENLKTILVIDDDPTTLNLLRTILTNAGYIAVTESNAEKAFYFLEHNQVDLILLDILMPEMDGYQLCSILKTKPEYESIPVIFLTALADQESLSNSFAVGAVDFISKPYKTDELLARINVYLQLKGKNRNLNVREGNLHICSDCNNFWDGKNWLDVADYLTHYSTAKVDTKICPNCSTESNNQEPKPLTSVTQHDSPKKKYEILIIDDHPENIHLLGQLLVKHDFKVHSAESGLKVLDFIKERQPDLILLDIMMPEMDGYEVCRKLKDDNLTRNIPIIFLTAIAGHEAIIKGFEVGGNDFITKPFRITEVLARINAQLEYKQIRDLINQNDDSLTVCEQCKNIKGYQGDWMSIEKIFSTFGASILMYTVCPKCMEKKYKV